MKFHGSASPLLLIICSSLIGLLLPHGLDEQTLIKTPNGFKTIKTIAQRVSKNKEIISYSVKQLKNVTGSVKKAGKSSTNFHIRMRFDIPGTHDFYRTL